MIIKYQGDGFVVKIPDGMSFKEFIEESNKHKISDEFLEECREVSKMFKKVDSDENKNYSERIAVYAGSFDPITLGHLDIIKKASSQYDKVVVGILSNKSKKGFIDFNLRKELVEDVVKEESLNNVVVEIFEGLVVDLLKKVEAKTLVRGLRTSEDFIYEQRLNSVNKTLYKDFESVYFMSEPEYIQCSSSIVRELLSFNADISNYVHNTTVKKLIENTVKK